MKTRATVRFHLTCELAPAAHPILFLLLVRHMELKFFGSHAHYFHAPSDASRFFETPRRLYGCACSPGVRARTYRIPNAFGTDTCLSIYLRVPLRAISGSRLLNDIRARLDCVRTAYPAPTPRRRFHAQTIPRAAAQLLGCKSFAIFKEF